MKKIINEAGFDIKLANEYFQSENFKGLQDFNQLVLRDGKTMDSNFMETFLSYFNNVDEYNSKVVDLGMDFHKQLPKSILEKCAFCKGKKDAEPLCSKDISDFTLQIRLNIYFFVLDMINQSELVSTFTLKRKMALNFLNHLEIIDGKVCLRESFTNLFLFQLIELEKGRLALIKNRKKIINEVNSYLYDLNYQKIQADLSKWTISKNFNIVVDFYQNELTYRIYEQTINQPLAKKSKSKSIHNTNVCLIDFFEHTSKYFYVIDILVNKELVQPVNNIWIDNKKGSRTIIASLIKTLHSKGYFTNNIAATNQEIVTICKNTFSKRIGFDTAKRSTVNNVVFKFIPNASHV